MSYQLQHSREGYRAVRSDGAHLGRYEVGEPFGWVEPPFATVFDNPRDAHNCAEITGGYREQHEIR